MDCRSFCLQLATLCVLEANPLIRNLFSAMHGLLCTWAHLVQRVLAAWLAGRLLRRQPQQGTGLLPLSDLNLARKDSSQQFAPKD